jgi:hypothetical protein
MSAATEPTGFRRDIMVLHALSDLMEKRADLPRPQVEFARRYQVEERAHINWHLSADWSGGPKWVYSEQTYEEYEASRRDHKRVDLEQRIAAIVEALGPDIEWEKNDPTQEEYYYKLSTVWHGARLTITTSREDVCEKVVLLETEHEEEVPDPEKHEIFLAAVPKVKVMVKDTITEWQCNTALAEATAPKHTRTVTEVPT